jgi:ParB-like chromosome segregation protein Spo0J
MNHKIHESLADLAVDVETLLPLPGNPRRGDVEAIATSYDEFGQVKPIVVRPNEDGTATVIAGNHQLQAAKLLGWSHIAAVEMEADDQRALLFALTDNRIAELGDNDDRLLNELLTEIDPGYYDFLDVLGWDEYDMAEIEVSVEEVHRNEEQGGAGFTAPVLIEPDPVPVKPEREQQPLSPEARHVEAPEGIDTEDVVTRGATAASSSASGNARAVVQYNLVFDDADQQRRWYDFLRWLRADAGTDGDTTAQKLVNFLEDHVDF